MENTKELVLDLAKMLEEHKLMEAFEKYYADEVIMQENESEPFVSKATNHAREDAFVGGLTEFRDLKVLGVAWGENYSSMEYFMDVTHKDWGIIKKTQVAVQRWKDGKIVSEKFYYDTVK
ncbi:MAG: nuclear transport factor 2 family protein [bacterium]|nr:nuclear transport factor 2 family protein [bacterium]